MKSWESKYNKIDSLGNGGNGDVFKVSVKCGNSDANEFFALKQLRSKDSVKQARFIREIKTVVQKLNSVEGVVPILDYSETEYWYVMPLGQSLTEYITGKKTSFEEVINISLELAKVMLELHNTGYSHRDLKPANILWYNNRPCFCDFGLVKDESDINNLTKDEKFIGAKFTVAPEMKRYPDKADGKKADVYSFAKTIWMLLTGDEFGFEGCYNFEDTKHSIRKLIKSDFLPKVESYDDNGHEDFEKGIRIARKQLHLVELENLLKDSTANDPDARPSTKEFVDRLQEYIVINGDSDKKQESDWLFLSKYLFNGFIPRSAVWDETENIIRVLNILGSVPSFNHTFLPSGGGVDFEEAAIAPEKECIELRFDLETSIVKPKALHFESFGNEYRFNYFLLETGDLKPIFPEDETGRISYGCKDEWLCEDVLGHYISDNDFSYGVYDYDSGIPLPPTARRVTRYIHGNFLFALKSGEYNEIPSVYDYRHDKIRPSHFRFYCDTLITVMHEIENEGHKRENFLISDLPNDIFDRLFPDVVAKEKKLEEDKENIKKSPYEFLKDNILKWNYKDLIDNYQNAQQGSICFYFEVANSMGISINNLDKEKVHYISKSGSIIEKDFFDAHYRDMDISDFFKIYNREDAIDFKNKFVEKIKEHISDNDYDANDGIINSSLIIHLKKNGKPTNLFTPEQIKDVMRNADDRHDNYLVIDENGLVHIITSENKPGSYPVSNGVWCSRNGYVGKYANLDEPFVHSIYRNCLEAWLHYLQNGIHISVNELGRSNLSDEDVIKKIMEYY